MKLRIGIPNNPIYSVITANIEKAAKQFDLLVTIDTEQIIREKFQNNLFDVALLTPIGYGMGIAKADYRIIKGPAVSAAGYTGLMSLVFNEGLRDINNVIYPNDKEYPILMTQMLINERYDIYPKAEFKTGNPEELIKETDVIFCYGKPEFTNSAIDVTEDWFDTFNFHAPLAFWCCRNEEVPENIENIINVIAGNTLQAQLEKHAGDENDYDMSRVGNINCLWDDEMRDALEQTMQLLFYYRLTDEIGAVKILGSNEEPL